MQSTPLQKVFAALTIEEQPHIYVSDAARLGFPPGQIPRSLLTDLGNGRRLMFCGLYQDGTAIYEQHRVKQEPRLQLLVENAAPERMPASMKVQTEICPACLSAII